MPYDNLFLFPLKLGVSTDEDFLYQQEMIEWIIRYKENDVDNTVEISNCGGYQSRENFYMEPAAEDFTMFLDKIWKQINETIKNYSEGLSTLKNNRIALQNIWLNVNGPGSFNHKHQHPGSLLSGVLWVKTPENSGSLIMHDPLEMNTYPLGPNVFKFEPIEGAMVLFPACIPHNVMPNKSQEDRISISFNLDFG
tara:strand:- start:12821 stop:13405 length:585 start_codon:yes stop_codon:yes gene_type:complete